MITKTTEHETDRAGKRLLRGALEPLGWVVNDVQEDYGIDSSVQVFDGQTPTGAWFHVQLKSSLNPDYSSDGSFISHSLRTDHARHFAFELRHPMFLILADVAAKRIFWACPQLTHKFSQSRTTKKLVTDRTLPRLHAIAGNRPVCHQNFAVGEHSHPILEADRVPRRGRRNSRLYLSRRMAAISADRSLFHLRPRRGKRPGMTL